MKSILPLALSVAVTAFAASAALAQEAEGPVAATTGTFGSNKLIDFEDDLDSVKAGFAQALAKGSDSNYESLLAELEERGTALQKEVVKAGLLDFVEVRNEVNTISDAYRYLKDSLAKGEKIPLVVLFSTRRHNRAEGQGVAENWAAFKCRADMDDYYTPYAALESKGYSRVAPGDVVEAIANLRQMIRWMERSGKWNALANNGRPFVVNEAPQTEWAAEPMDLKILKPAKEREPIKSKQPQEHKKIEF